jgi:hypothetical protein
MDKLWVRDLLARDQRLDGRTGRPGARAGRARLAKVTAGRTALQRCVVPQWLSISSMRTRTEATFWPGPASDD